MGTLNRVMIMGNLGADPELRHTASGQAVTTLSVATSRAYTDRDGVEQKVAEWHRVVVWGKQAEVCAQYLSKGRRIFVEGRLATRSWEDRNGEKRYATEIVASNIQFLGGPHAPEGADQHGDFQDVAVGGDHPIAGERAAQPLGGRAHGRDDGAGAVTGSTAVAADASDFAAVTPAPRRATGSPMTPPRMPLKPQESRRPRLEDIPF